MKETLFGQIEIAGMSPRFGILNLDGGRTTLTLQGDNIAHAFPFVAGESCHIKGMFENDTRQFHMLGALIPNTTGDTLTLRPSVGLESSLPPDEAASLFTSLFRTADSGIAEIGIRRPAGLTRLLAPREQATASTTSHPTAWGPARLIAPDDRTDLSPVHLGLQVRPTRDPGGCMDESCRRGPSVRVPDRTPPHAQRLEFHRGWGLAAQGACIRPRHPARNRPSGRIPQGHDVGTCVPGTCWPHGCQPMRAGHAGAGICFTTTWTRTRQAYLTDARAWWPCARRSRIGPEP